MKTTILNPTINETFAALPAKGCSVLSISNVTGVNIEIRRVDDPGNKFTLLAGMGIDLNAENVSEWECRRATGTGELTLEILVD